MMFHPLLSRRLLLPTTSIIGKKAGNFSTFFTVLGLRFNATFDNALKIICLWQCLVADILYALKAEFVGAKKINLGYII